MLNFLNDGGGVDPVTFPAAWFSCSLTIASVPSLAPHTSGQQEIRRPHRVLPKRSGCQSSVYVLAWKGVICIIMCACVGMLLLFVCLVIFCVDILSVEGTCLPLVMSAFFLCTYVVSVLMRLFSTGCGLLFYCLSLFVDDSRLLLCASVSYYSSLLMKWWCLGLCLCLMCRLCCEL